MLCESLLHVLVEEGVISHAKAIESIEGVAEISVRFDPLSAHFGSRSDPDDPGERDAGP
jgi:hypothetical protein